MSPTHLTMYFHLLQSADEFNIYPSYKRSAIGGCLSIYIWEQPQAENNCAALRDETNT